MTLTRLAISAVALASAASATPATDDVQRIEDLCKFIREAESYQGQSVILTTRIVDVGPHGWFVEDSNCPRQILQIYPATDPDKRTLKALLEASNRGGVEPNKIAIIRGTVVMKERRVQGIDETQVLPMLEVTKVIGWEPVTQ
jgi:hypothetical protein